MSEAPVTKLFCERRLSYDSTNFLDIPVFVYSSSSAGWSDLNAAWSSAHLTSLPCCNPGKPIGAPDANLQFVFQNFTREMPLIYFAERQMGES